MKIRIMNRMDGTIRERRYSRILIVRISLETGIPFKTLDWMIREGKEITGPLDFYQRADRAQRDPGIRPGEKR
jgi:hypothetical protein